MDMPPLPMNPQAEAETAFLLASVVAVQRTRLLAVAVFCLLIYDYLLTIDLEIEFFWSGKWTISRILYFVNRYCPPFILVLGLICLFVPNLSFEFCTAAIPAVFTLDSAAMAVVQAIIVVRCWYLFQNSPWSRAVVLFAYIGCTVSTFTLLGLTWNELRPIEIAIPGLVWDGCTAPNSKHIWRIFIPGIVIHSVLYGATIIPALRLKSQGKSSPIMNRVLRDGGVFYIFVFVAAAFSGIGAVSKNLNVTTPAMYSNVLLGLTSTAVSRLMLSMHSLAANLHMDPKWLLNNAELSRVRWHKGTREGEIIVEVDVAEAEEGEDAVVLDTLELGGMLSAKSGKTFMDGSDTDADSERKTRVEQIGETRKKDVYSGYSGRRPGTPGITTTRVGVYEDLPNMFYKGKGDTRP